MNLTVLGLILIQGYGGASPVDSRPIPPVMVASLRVEQANIRQGFARGDERAAGMFRRGCWTEGEYQWQYRNQRDHLDRLSAIPIRTLQDLRVWRVAVDRYATATAALSDTCAARPTGPNPLLDADAATAAASQAAAEALQGAAVRPGYTRQQVGGMMSGIAAAAGAGGSSPRSSQGVQPSFDDWLEKRMEDFTGDLDQECITPQEFERLWTAPLTRYVAVADGGNSRAIEVEQARVRSSAAELDDIAEDYCGW